MGPAMPTQAERDATRGKLLAVARKLFATKGFAATSLDLRPPLLPGAPSTTTSPKAGGLPCGLRGRRGRLVAAALAGRGRRPTRRTVSLPRGERRSRRAADRDDGWSRRARLGDVARDRLAPFPRARRRGPRAGDARARREAPADESAGAPRLRRALRERDGGRALAEAQDSPSSGAGGAGRAPRRLHHGTLTRARHAEPPTCRPHACQGGSLRPSTQWRRASPAADPHVRGVRRGACHDTAPRERCRQLPSAASIVKVARRSAAELPLP